MKPRLVGTVWALLLAGMTPCSVRPGFGQTSPPTPAAVQRPETLSTPGGDAAMPGRIPVAGRAGTAGLPRTGHVAERPKFAGPEGDERAGFRPGPAARAHPSKAASAAAPALEIQQTTPENVRPGAPIPIEITVQNTGSVAVDKVIVTDTLPAGARLVEGNPKAVQNEQTCIWSLGRIEPGRSRSIHLVVELQSEPADGRFANSCEVSFATSVTSTSRVSAPRLTLAVAGPESTCVGTPVTYTITLANRGNASATNVVLRDRLPEGLSHPYGPDLENEIGVLEPGQSRQVQLTVVPTLAGEIKNRIVLVGDETAPAEHETLLRAEKIELALAGNGPAVRFLSQACKYEFTATNKSAVEVRQVRAVVTLPSGLTFAHASDEGRHDSALHSVAWELGTLQPGETRAVSLTGVPAALGDLACRAVLSAAGNVSAETQINTSVQGIVALNIGVQDLADPVEIGGETAYEIRVVNQGTTPAANVRILAEIPPELLATAADGPLEHSVDNRLVRFSPIESLPPKEQVAIRIKVKGVRSGDARFRVTVEADQLSRAVIKEESTTVFGDQ